MPNELLQELDQFMGSVRSNPPEEKLYEFLQELSSDGKLFGYPEQDWIEAGHEYQMTDDDIAEWIETAASWIEDTTQEGELEPELAFWSDEPKPNPAVRYGKGTEIEDCVCEETCSCDPCPCDECEECEFCKCCCTCEEPEEDEDDNYDGDESEEE